MFGGVSRGFGRPLVPPVGVLRAFQSDSTVSSGSSGLPLGVLDQLVQHKSPMRGSRLVGRSRSGPSGCTQVLDESSAKAASMKPIALQTVAATRKRVTGGCARYARM